MTIEQKAKAFDLIADGHVSLASIIWKQYSKLQTKNNQSDAANELGPMLAQAAAEQVFDEESAEDHLIDSIFDCICSINI